MKTPKGKKKEAVMEMKKEELIEDKSDESVDIPSELRPFVSFFLQICSNFLSILFQNINICPSL